MAKKPKLSGADLRAFRRSVSILKKKGLVSKRTDARKQKPTRYMLDKVRNLKPVIEGKQTTVKLDRKTVARYKEAGFTTFGNRVVVAKGQAEKVRRDKGSGLIVISDLRGRLPFEKVVMPYGINSLEKFLDVARQSPPDPQIFAARKNPTDYWAFTYHGNNSLSAFADLGLLAEHIFALVNHYIDLKNQPDNPRLFQHFILYRTKPEFWARKVVEDADNRKRERRRSYNKDRKDQRRAEEAKRLKLRGREIMQARRETQDEMNARHQREWRERQKEKRKGDADLDALMKQRAREQRARQRASRKALDER